MKPEGGAESHLSISSCCAGLTDTVALLHKAVAAGIAPAAIPPERAPNGGVVVVEDVLLVSRVRLLFLTLDQAPCCVILHIPAPLKYVEYVSGIVHFALESESLSPFDTGRVKYIVVFSLF